MSSNYCGPLVDRRAMAPPSCMQFGVPPPHGYPRHSPPEALANIPFLFYPTNLDPAYYETYGGMFPYSPFHNHFGIYDSPFEPAFIQKRNERERQRVKCVNEGYARLRGHLPGALSEKRLSKVETLRAAIKYIQYLQDILNSSPDSEEDCDAKGGAIPRFSAKMIRDYKSKDESELSRTSPTSSPSSYCDSEESNHLSSL
ncbi:achaete-scute homolog 5 [Ambystoma mexicanum]|uniref:achaete-scute homolog 5 n=1 Tax=Ambystoma mexicanum TaxID=8296 RepID=UPI0037E9A014